MRNDLVKWENSFLGELCIFSVSHFLVEKTNHAFVCILSKLILHSSVLKSNFIPINSVQAGSTTLNRQCQYNSNRNANYFS